ncbi:uncharacterized protein LOC117109271 [Anneissia japonica]|uniref:uncharacterized protein LOC117109271 n=1 Tax=Anneissia japonica TaxID=1529436 RepID=UPI00142558DF|nr:uncharacterized protein LOC117109271 [Anneissia japonica]
MSDRQKKMADHNYEEKDIIKIFKKQLLAFGLTWKTIEILLNMGFCSLEDLRCLKVKHLDELHQLSFAQRVKMEKLIDQNWIPYDEKHSLDFKEHLLSQQLSEQTVDILISNGFDNMCALRCLNVTDFDSMQDLTLAQKAILRKKMDDKWVGNHAECNDMKENGHEQKLYEELKRDQTVEQDENTSRTPNYDHVDQPKPRSSKRAFEQPKTSFRENSENELKEERKKSNFSSKSETKTDGRQRDKEKTSHSSYKRFTSTNSYPNVEESSRRPSPRRFVEHMKCNVARDHFNKKEYVEMECILINLEEESKSAMGRIRFGSLISKGCSDFSELHDCLNSETTDVHTLHDVICHQLITLAESHGTLLNEMGLTSENQVFSEWAHNSSAVFKHDSNLEYDSNQWKDIIGKTEELVDYFSSLSIPAQNVTKSFILLILQFVNRVWITRNHILPSDHHGLLRIATFAIYLCECRLVSSRCFCELKYNSYAHAAITLGCNIANSRLEVEHFYDHFHVFKSKMEEYLNQCLELGVDPETDDNERNLERFSSDVETEWANYKSAIDSEDEELPYYSKGDDGEKQRLVELQVVKLNQLFCNKHYSEFRRSIVESENILQETDFKLNIAVSPKFEEIHKSVSELNFGSAHELLESLQHKLLDLVIDHKSVLGKMKMYCNDALAKWTELFVTFCSSQDCIYGSELWKESLAVSQITIDNAQRGIDPNGQMVIQLYLQLMITMIMKFSLAYERAVPNDYASHVRLAFMNMTMLKSSLLNSQWYSKLKYDVYQCAVRSLGACIINENIPADHSTYEQYKHVKDIHDKLDVSCRKLSIYAGSTEARENLKRLNRDVERKVFGKPRNQKIYEARKGGHQVNVIGSDPHVARYIEESVQNYYQRKFDEMTVCLNDAETFDGTCDIRLAFAGNCSPNFNAAVNFSNNIPEHLGLGVVIKTTYDQLMNLADDHQRIMTYMKETNSLDMVNLIKYLFGQDINYGTDEWEIMIKKSKQVVTYFESLTPNGQSVTKAYVLLLLTILHNFIATRNRLCTYARHKLLPFVICGVPFCESKMLAFDAWTHAKFSVYELAVVTIAAALKAGQIPCCPSYPKYCRKLWQLKESANKLGISVIGKEKENFLNEICQAGNELYKGSEDRMHISAALLYFDARCYMGMMAILNAGDETYSNAVHIRMNFMMRISDEFETCVDYHNQISHETSYENLISKGYEMLHLFSKDHSKIVRKIEKSSSDALCNWVDAVFQAKGSRPDVHPDTYGSDEWESMLEKSRIARKYIMGLSKVSICISQAYLSFFMSWCMNFISKRHRLCPIKNDFTGELRLILAVIELCKEALTTSLLSIETKERAYGLAALLLTQVENTGEAGIKEMEEITKVHDDYTEKIKSYDQKLQNRETNKKYWPSEDSYDDGFDEKIGQPAAEDKQDTHKSNEEFSEDMNPTGSGNVKSKNLSTERMSCVITSAGEHACIVGGDQIIHNYYMIQGKGESTEELSQKSLDYFEMTKKTFE